MQRAGLVSSGLTVVTAGSSVDMETTVLGIWKHYQLISAVWMYLPALSCWERFGPSMQAFSDAETFFFCVGMSQYNCTNVLWRWPLTWSIRAQSKLLCGDFTKFLVTLKAATTSVYCCSMNSGGGGHTEKPLMSYEIVCSLLMPSVSNVPRSDSSPASHPLFSFWGQ